MTLWLLMSGLGVVPVVMAQEADVADGEQPTPQLNLELGTEVNFGAWDRTGDWASVRLNEVETALKATCDERKRDFTDLPECKQAGSLVKRFESAQVVTAAVFEDGKVNLYVHLPEGWTMTSWAYKLGTESRADLSTSRDDWTKGELENQAGLVDLSLASSSQATTVSYQLKVVDEKGREHDIVSNRDARGGIAYSGEGESAPSVSFRGTLTTLTTLTSGIDQGAILLGLSDYLLDRAEAELRAWAIQSQVNQLCMTQTKDGKAPLPGDFLESTCAALAHDGVSMVFNGTSLLQEAARKDLNALVRNVGEAAVRYYNGKAPSPGPDGLNPHDVGASLALMGRVLELVLDGEHPLDAIAGMVTGKDWGGLQPGTMEEATLTTLGTNYKLTSTVLLGAVGVVTAYDYLSTEGQAFLKAPFVRNVGGDQPFEVEKPFGENLRRASLTGLDTALLSDKASASIKALVQHLTTSDSLTTIETNLKRVQELISKTTLGADPDDLPALRQQMLQAYAQVAAETMTLSAGTVGAMAKAIPKGSEDLLKKLSKAQDLLTDLSHVAAHTAKGAYGPALLNGLALLTDRIGDGAGDEQKELLAALGIVQTQLTFLATLSEANTPEAAQAAIAAWASPVGSYRTKHLGTGGWVGLNAYVGMGGGVEYLLNVDGLDQWRSKPTPQFAPMVSVGLEVGMNTRWDNPYFGLYLQALDLGAIGTFRMDDSVESTESEAQTIEANLTSKLRVQHVFSPGLFAVYAPANAPFTIGLGGSLVPSLRSISIDGEPQLDDADALRAGLFLAVDMPLIHN